MSEELQLASLTAKTMEAAGSPGLNMNLESVMKVLGEIDKIMSMLEKWGVRTPIIRLLAQKAGISQDIIDKPLAKETGGDNVVYPKSQTHKQLFDELQKLDEVALKQQLAAQLIAYQEMSKNDTK